MPKSIISAAITLSLSANMATAQTFHIEANLSIDDDTIYVVNHKTYHRDTVTASKGRFSLDIPVTEPEEMTISAKPFPMPSDRNAIRFVAMPGESVTITGDYACNELGGGRFYDEYSKMRMMLQGIEARNETNVEWSTMLRENKVEHDSITPIFHSIRNANITLMQEASVRYMMLHPDEECSALLFENIRDVHKARRCYDALSERVRGGRMGAVMAKYLSHVDNEISRLERAREIQPGKPAPLFTLKDIKGKRLSVEKLRGKWVVLDFWGSWCFWCINGVPQMRRYYEKYKGRFEILSIDCYDKPEAWKNAVARNDMPWLHVIDPTPGDAGGEERKNGIAYRYAISGFPTKIVIRPDGIIDRVFIGEKEDFYEYLDKLFGSRQ